VHNPFDFYAQSSIAAHVQAPRHKAAADLAERSAGLWVVGQHDAASIKENHP